MEELELPWASGTFVADIWEGTGLACRQTLPGYSGFEPKISGFFFGGGRNRLPLPDLFSSFRRLDLSGVCRVWSIGWKQPVPCVLPLIAKM